MKKRILIYLVLFFSFHLRLFPKRIITLSPALTEIVFALGNGNMIVGNTRFCDYPEEAKSVFHVGGIVDLNIESIMSLQPEIIFLYPELLPRLQFLSKSVNLVVLPHSTIQDLYSSIEVVSRELMKVKEGKRLIKDIKSDLNKVAKKLEKPKRCMLIVGRDIDDSRNMYIMGKNDFLNEILELCGGKNVYNGNIAYPIISIESVIYLNPEYIFEISAFYEGISQESLLKIWENYRFLAAVRNKRILFIKNSAWLRPGPRIGSIAKDLSQILLND